MTIVETIAGELQQWLRVQHGMHVPIETEGATRSDGAAPAIVVRSWSGGDIYSGGTYSTSLRLRVLRADGTPLSIDFAYDLHDLSGQCDGWVAVLDGVRDDERAALAAMFGTARYSGHWNDNGTRRVTLNGVAL